MSVQGSTEPNLEGHAKKRFASISVALLLWIGLIFSTAETAAQTSEDGLSSHVQIVAKLIAGDYSRRGADVCLGCHDEEEPFPNLEIFANVHGHPNVVGSPFSDESDENFPAGLQCEACHGPAGGHSKKLLSENELREPMINFGAKANVVTELQNQICLACHEDFDRSHWQDSPHSLGDVACTDCHLIHSRADPVRVKSSHNEMCISCHVAVGAAQLMKSSHPMRENQLVCRDCHNPHGGQIISDDLVHKKSVTEACLDCHQEKVGPFIWEHPPVVEDCSICHVPHGSNQPALLKRRAPQLCQACHSSVGHRSLRMDLKRTTSDSGAEFQFLNACLNCHVQIHGSDHPSGNLFRR